ncbi:MAG: hypothetical protein M1434_14230 [Chloroflexi bacterium]|nr:hypothetical protein [Chloroflexota bacterium]MCL5275879.1 hypothetical protein [Chloroflexota bacterium]
MDPESIDSHLQAAVEARRQQSGLPDAEFEILATGTSAHPTIEELERRCESLSHALRYSSVEIILSEVKPSPVRPLIQRARAMLHGVILFYVNRLAMQQAAINRLNLQVLSTAAALIKSQQVEIDKLRASPTHSDGDVQAQENLPTS